MSQQARASSSTTRPGLFATLAEDLRIVIEDVLRLGVGRSFTGTLA